MKIIYTLKLVIALLFVNFSFGQNPSDDCTSVPSLTVNSSCTSSAYTLPGGYSNGSSISASCFTSGQDRDDGWYQVTATSTGTMTIELSGDQGHTLAIFSSCAGGTELACDQQIGGTTSIVSFAATNGTTYWVQVHRNEGNNSQDMIGTICAYSGSVSGGGTNCLDATALTPGSQQCGTNSNIGSLPDDGSAPTNPCNSSYNDGEYWYSYTGDGQALQLDVTNLTDTYSGLFVLDNCPSGSPNCIASYTSSSSSSDFTLTTPALTNGQVYYIVMANWSAPYQTDFCLDATSVIPPPVPANDDCVGAYVLTVNPDNACGTVTSGTVLNATTSTQNSASCAGTEDDDVWFSFVATNTSHYIDIVNTAGSTTDMYHSVWEGGCPGLSLVAGTCSDGDSQTVTGLTPGNTYFVRVYTYTSTGGQNSTFDVCIGTPPPPPSNDDCIDAIPAVVNSDAVCTSVTSGWTLSATESLTGCTGTADDDVWFSFIALDVNQDIEILNATGTTDMVHEVFSGSCGSLTSLGCSDPNTSSYTGLTIGNTYFVRVYTYSSSGENTGFDLCITSPCGIGGTPPTCGLNYGHSTIPYNPTNYNTGTSLVFPDDQFAPSYTSIGFDFCFDGVIYSDLLVSSNGYLIFPGCYSAAPTATTVTPGGSSAYSMYTDAPNIDDAPRNAIMGVWHDINPSISGSAIRYSTVGTAPNRVFICKFDDVGMYSCTTDNFSSQIMLYETTNNIEVHIGEKTVCTGWNSGGAIMGLHNFDGSAAVVPAGYNFSTQWTVATNSPEGHLFTNNCADCIVTLPVELINFTGEAKDDYNLITWSTVTERDNDYFILEKSTGGDQFEFVAMIDGAGNSTEELHYEYKHSHPESVQYYRLRQVDFDGKVHYSKVISVNTSSKSTIEIYPNPTTDNLHFNIKNGSSLAGATITYVDVTGKALSEKINTSQNNNSFKSNLFYSLDKGVYIVKITNKEGILVKTEMIIKQ